MIDFRSDTVTKPTKEMLQAMFEAKVGDDVFGNDPSVNALEEKVAKLFQYEGALFCASGTMTNQIALKIQTRPGQEIICEQNAHIYRYEAGGIASNAHCSVRLIEGDFGRIRAEQIASEINADSDLFPKTSLVSIENTTNKGGGAIYELEEIKKIKKLCQEHSLVFHLDGARIFNALVETQQKPAELSQYFNSISVCLSKGLGCPVGSVLLGNKEMIKQARKQRKAWGGGWRQAGYLAAAGIYALDHHLDRLKDDHRRAKVLAQTLESHPWIAEVSPVHTNICIVKIKNDHTAEEFVARMDEKGIACVTFGKQLVRFVTHLDITDQDLDQTIDTITHLK